MSKLSQSIIDKFSNAQRQSKLGMVVIFFEKIINIIRKYLVFLIIPLFNDGFDLVYIGLVTSLIFVITAVITYIEFKYFTFRFDFSKNDFVIKKGFLKKTKLSVPLNKIQQINLNQNFVHKILNLYEVQMETAGSDSKEVNIKAIEKNLAIEIKDFTDSLKERVKINKIDEKSENHKLEIDFFTLIKTGLTSRYFETLGFIIALFFGLLEYLDALSINYIPSFSSFIKNGDFGFIAVLFYVILIIFGVLGSNLITTLVKYYKFFTLKTNNNLTISYGLLSTKTTMMSPNKVQIFSYTQNWIQKKIDLCNILIFQASSEMNMSEKSNEGSKIRIPGANKNDRDKIFDLIYKSSIKEELIFKPNIRKFVLNFSFFGLFLSAIFFTIQYYFSLVDSYNYIIFQTVYLILVTFISWRMYKNNFLFISDNFIRIQSGFWDISTKIIEIHKIQSIKVYQDIWYKRLNLADLNISTAGGEIRFNFMNDNIINKLVDTLAYKVEVSKKNWM